jgi:hypothetical protein
VTPAPNTTDVTLRPTITITFYTADNALGDEALFKQAVEQYMRFGSQNGQDILDTDCSFTWGGQVHPGGAGTTITVKITPNRDLYPNTKYVLTLEGDSIRANTGYYDGVRHDQPDTMSDTLVTAGPPAVYSHTYDYYFLDGLYPNTRGSVGTISFTDNTNTHPLNYGWVNYMGYPQPPIDFVLEI